MNNISMLHYDRIDVSDGIDINKANASNDYDIYHYWYFLNKGFEFQPYVCNMCHDLLMMSINLNDIAILNIRGVDYHSVMFLLRNIDVTKKRSIIKK